MATYPFTAPAGRQPTFMLPSYRPPTTTPNTYTYTNSHIHCCIYSRIVALHSYMHRPTIYTCFLHRYAGLLQAIERGRASGEVARLRGGVDGGLTLPQLASAA